MATLQDLIDKVVELGNDRTDVDAKNTAAQTALQQLADVTLSEATTVQAALAHQQQEVSTAQSAADSAVATAQAATDEYNRDLDQLIELAQSLKVPTAPATT